MVLFAGASAVPRNGVWSMETVEEGKHSKRKASPLIHEIPCRDATVQELHAVANGPLKYIDKNGVNRLTIKQGSSRAPGSASPHVELRNASGQRVDPAGNPVTRKSPGNHTPIDFDL